MCSFDQSAIRSMSATGTPWIYLWVTDAPQTLQGLNTEVSVPTADNTDLIHLATVAVDTAL